LTASTWARVSSPRPMPDWLETTPTAVRPRAPRPRPPSPRDELDLRGVAVVGHVVDEGAVAVEEHRPDRDGPRAGPAVPPPSAELVPHGGHGDRRARAEHPAELRDELGVPGARTGPDAQQHEPAGEPGPGRRAGAGAGQGGAGARAPAPRRGDEGGGESGPGDAQGADGRDVPREAAGGGRRRRAPAGSVQPAHQGVVGVCRPARAGSRGRRRDGPGG
jgi:hypothetical protein